MDKTEATTKIIVSMIENGFFKDDIINKKSDVGSKVVTEAFKEIYDVIKAKTP